MTFVAGNETPDWTKPEAYVPNTNLTSITEAMNGATFASSALSNCVAYVSRAAADHFLPSILFSGRSSWSLPQSTCLYREFSDRMLLLSEARKTTSEIAVSIIYSAHADIKPSNLVRYADAFAHTVPDLLHGYEEYGVANWDGYGADPITAATLAYARRLMKIIPTSLGAPDAAPAGDGSIALEWVPEDPTHKLDRLFLDIGPGEVWRAYWTLRTGEFYRVTHDGLSDETTAVLKGIFQDLSA
ncbi:hypothetical protein [Bradyrhizobium pachyrhizi]|uniref:hypothetical protein n=1 Tax=Bradyrhizobium pachyrhizi TaxID=280333 RepID=UPI003D36A769